ncbi:Cdc15p [Rhizophagus irregularis DAOM 197198w]|uniref:Cdc15p n=1 Tax=Rhizophagus irregularis (strain DAOM 197198w) TaxID=1432141 RepID=A0A015IFN3_RHIIW|nr:Cdc15p [Rhizophagus irregularis DAOM 197198w]
MTNVEYGGYENIKIIEIDRCSGCGQKFADEILSYCKPCYSSHFRNNFVHWKSGSLRIDKLIQDSQLNANHQYELIEWIEYSNLEIIKFVAYGGFGNVYEAIWKDGPIDSWNINKSGWNRNSNKKVAIKKLRNVTSVSSEYLNEVKNNLMLNYTARCNGIYGMTRDTQNGEYVIVTEFQNDGNMRELIKKNYSILNWKLIIKMLYNICDGLSAIHDKNYHHRDFHSGNILNSIHNNTIKSVISDFGLCSPANQSSADKSLYGVLPFVAPEVLRGGEFTKSADIYGFGMLMLEIISVLAICEGERPPIPEYTPEPYATLMEHCWDPIPTNRPTTDELYGQIVKWETVICKFEHSDSQVETKIKIKEAFSHEREEKWKLQLAELAANSCPLKKSQNMLASKKLDCLKQLTAAKDVEMKTNDYSMLYTL